jgi:hypothetical protein
MLAPKSPLQWTDAFRWLIFPAIYVTYAMLRSNIEGFYPYPFLNADTLTSGRVFINCEPSNQISRCPGDYVLSY